jgi:MarR family
MDTVSAADLAKELGTSVPRITRAARQLGIDAQLPNGRFAFSPSQARRLRAALGKTPALLDLSRSEAIVLAALRDAPFGLVSVRAVARRSGLSPTAAGRALESLLAKRLVSRSKEMMAAGRAREVQIWRANLAHPRWPALDPLLSQLEQPVKARRKEAGRVPRRLRHLFWNTAESQLDVARAGAYVARRLLRTMDLQGLAWGAKTLSSRDWERAARARGLDPKVRRLALNLAEAAR